MAIANLCRYKVIFTRISVSWVIVGIVSLPGFTQTVTPAATSKPSAATPNQTTTSSPSPSPQTAQTATPLPTSSPQSTPKATPAPTPLEQAQELWQKQQFPLIIAVICGVGYLGVLWLKPLWLLKLPATDLTLPFTPLKVPLGWLRWFKYRSRVLDAWVECYWQTVQEQFLRLPTVEGRKIHISLPVQLDEKLLESLSGQDLTEVFKRKVSLLLIKGEGGAGKTSLACQISLWGLEKKLGSHRMLPVLIETELDEKKTLIEAIRRQLGILTDQEEPIATELLQKLLQRQRVLVIVDHLSEMSEASRKQCLPDQSDFPVNALVVTSRLPELLGNLPKTILEPLRIEGGRLSRFMDAYLTQQNKRDLFEDEDYFDACRRLSRMVGQRNITILLARLYADQMVEQQKGSGGTLPASVPELMLSYVNQLNRAIELTNRSETLQVQKDAQIVAWECLHTTYRPTSAKTESVWKALAPDAELTEAKERLKYLENRLRLVQTLEPGDRVRIILDPLAEYLAALWFVDDLCKPSMATQTENTPNQSTESEQTKLWQQFFQSIDQILEAENETGQIIQGFLLAVRDCCLLRQKQAGIPNEITEELARKAGLDPDELRRAEEKRRIRLLISDLSAPELEYRVRAAEDLGKRAASSRMAIPNLIGMVTNPNQDTEARQAAAKTLATLANTLNPSQDFGGGEQINSGNDLDPGEGERLFAPTENGVALRNPIAECFLNLLADTNENLEMRRSVAEALGAMKAGRTELLAILEDGTQPLPLRQGTARALGWIGAPNGQPVPMLIVEQQGGEILTEVKPIPVYRTRLTDDLEINWVAVPGGEFLMGSPSDEEGRDYYQYQSWAADTKGHDVEKQHRVRITPFWMSQYPVTQAQWQFVANLPKVKRNLDTDPSNFKGKNRPVESISGDDAQEFCVRLTQYTGITHRLPSEAEWEYACRAGTTSPYHFGETISADWVNYDANYTYADGVQGTYRQSTTDVGLFGLTNRFGLADMHGNVYEWCADAWHPSYEGAPVDGSFWSSEEENDNRSQILRGGSWIAYPAFCRSAFRDRNNRAFYHITVGFRVVAVPSP